MEPRISIVGPSIGVLESLNVDVGRLFLCEEGVDDKDQRIRDKHVEIILKFELRIFRLIR